MEGKYHISGGGSTRDKSDLLFVLESSPLHRPYLSHFQNLHSKHENKYHVADSRRPTKRSTWVIENQHVQFMNFRS